MSSRDLRGLALIRVTISHSTIARGAVAGLGRMGLLPPVCVVAKLLLSNIMNVDSWKVSMIVSLSTSASS